MGRHLAQLCVCTYATEALHTRAFQRRQLASSIMRTRGGGDIWSFAPPSRSELCRASWGWFCFRASFVFVATIQLVVDEVRRGKTLETMAPLAWRFLLLPCLWVRWTWACDLRLWLAEIAASPRPKLVYSRGSRYRCQKGCMAMAAWACGIGAMACSRFREASCKRALLPLRRWVVRAASARMVLVVID